MEEILRFIEVFRSPSNSILFSEEACYWFAIILHQRFPNSTIVYNPDIVHFATKIYNRVYDISGIVNHEEDYVEWEDYQEDDRHLIEECCIKLKGGDVDD